MTDGTTADIYFIRSFGAMNRRFNFSNLQWLKEGKVKKPTTLFQLWHLQFTCLDCTPTTNSPLPSYTHKHTLCLHPALGPHTRISVQFLPFTSAIFLPRTHECFLWTNSSTEHVFQPWSTKFGGFLGFLGVLSRDLQTKPFFLWENFITRNVVWTFTDKGTFIFLLLLPLNH